jgi:Fur family ferric uptake transcriptional regulator
MNNQQFISDLLRAHGLRKTPNRIEMLSLFIKHEAALSASDIITRMKSKLDRVTVYRALNAFETHGILHRASEDERGIKYALCERHCPDEAHADQHVHFVCYQCHQTFCLDNVRVPEVTVSDKFSVDRTNYTLSGTCQACNT